MNLAGPLAAVVEAREVTQEVTGTPTPALSVTPTETPTPTPTLTYRQRREQEAQELLGTYYERYGITPRPTQPPVTDGSGDPTLTSIPEAQEPSPTEPTPTVATLALEETDNYDSGEVDDPVATNENTGAGSYNDSGATEATETNVENENNLTQTDTFNETADTGYNSADAVTGNLTLETGAANLGYSETSKFNSNQNQTSDVKPKTSEVDDGSGSVDGTITETNNQNTGSGSINLTNAETSETTTVENSNTLNLKQEGTLEANSGSNLTESVIGDSEIKTGAANLSLNLINLGNTNVNQDTNLQTKNFDIYDRQIDDVVINFEESGASAAETSSSDNNFEEVDQQAVDEITAGNQNTQSGSVNEATSKDEETTITKNENNAKIEQDFTLNANTGGNVADGNTGATTIATGNINIAANIINFINTNLTGVSDFVVGTVNVFGELLGNVVLGAGGNSGKNAQVDNSVTSASAENSNTGSNTTNIATVTEESVTKIVNQNELTVDNNIKTHLTTGGNDISAINGDVVIETGKVESSINALTAGNMNATDLDGSGEEVFWLVVVNNIGEWTGKILGFEGQNYAVVDGYSLINSEDVTVESKNEGTLGSVNIANSTHSQETTIENTNTAEIKTSLQLNANTGANLINSNNGSAQIKTGDIKANANVVNLANLNLIGKRVIVAVVNVFGKFWGNILPPGWVPEVEDTEAENLTESGKLALEEPMEEPSNEPAGEDEVNKVAEGQPVDPDPTEGQAKPPEGKTPTPTATPTESPNKTAHQGGPASSKNQNSPEEAPEDADVETETTKSNEPKLPATLGTFTQAVKDLAVPVVPTATATPTPSYLTISPSPVVEPAVKEDEPLQTFVFTSDTSEENAEDAEDSKSFPAVLFLLALSPVAWVGRKIIELA